MFSFAGKKMKVMKFGGTSLGNAGMIKKTAALVEREKNCLVVCSAVAGVTDMLAGLVREWENGNLKEREIIFGRLMSHFKTICRELFVSPEEQDCAGDIVNNHFSRIRGELNKGFTLSGENTVMAQGEIITSRIIDLYLNANGIQVKLLNAFDFLSTGKRGDLSVNNLRKRLLELTGESPAGRYLTQGYICLDHKGDPSNLGRGGSDYTATLAGAALMCDRIEIWTDIDGIRNNDPRIVSETYPVRNLSFKEASELAYFGAKILHPECVWPARRYNIPVHIKKTAAPEAPGTIVCSEPGEKGVRAVGAKERITAIKIESGRMLSAYGFLSKIFAIFEKFRTPVDVVTTSEVSVSVTIDKCESLTPIISLLNELGEVHVERNLAIVCVVGDVLEKHKGHAVRILDSLKPFTVKMISFGGSRNNITIVVPEEEKEEVLNSLNSFLFVGKPKYKVR